VESIKDVLKNDPHHAYLFVGERTQLLPSVLESVQAAWNIDVQGNPDCIAFERDSFGIDDARELLQFVSGRTFSGGKRILIISFYSITIEAQNALLKILEEPKESTHFLILVPYEDMLLPTVRSRMISLAFGRKRISDETLAEKFLSTPKSKRLLLIKDIIEKKDKEHALLLLGQLEKIILIRCFPWSS